MAETLNIIKKPEAYSYDELSQIFNILSESKVENVQETVEKFETLKNALSQSKTSAAIFFMPENTFAIFSMFQGNTALCQLSLQDVENALTAIQQSSVTPKLASLLSEKLQTLSDFLKKGNAVKPVCIQSDGFTAFDE